MEGLKKRLADVINGSRKVVIIGVGSVLKADDAVGSIVASRLIEKYTESPIPKFNIYDGGTAPENFTGAIRGFGPDLAVVVDAADLKAEPGLISFIDFNSISGVSFSTHMLPLKFFIDYLRDEIGCSTVIVGIQPSDLTFGASMTSHVRKAASRLVRDFESIIGAKADL